MANKSQIKTAGTETTQDSPQQRITRRRWTPEEDAYIIAHYGKVKYQEIATALGRTYESVRSRAQVAGISNTNEQLRRGEERSLHLVPPVTLPDDGWIEPRPYASLSAAKIANMIRNSKIAVAVHLRHGQPKAAAALTEDIDAMTRELSARIPASKGASS